jgi:hypothetical protein
MLCCLCYYHPLIEELAVGEKRKLRGENGQVVAGINKDPSDRENEMCRGKKMQISRIDNATVSAGVEVLITSS